MATNQQTTTHWQESSTDLTKREKATIRANWPEVTAYVAPPPVRWEWGESGLSARMKHYLKHHGLIKSAEAGYWRTTEDLWLFLIENASDDETIGEQADGQTQLGVDVGEPVSETRSPDEHRTCNTAPGRQQTLTGGESSDAAKPSETLRVNRLKGNHTPPKHTRAAADDTQQPLDAVGDGGIDAPGAHVGGQATLAAFAGSWIGNWSGMSLKEPHGEIYG